MNTEKHNGFTNYATWLTWVNLANTEETYAILKFRSEQYNARDIIIHRIVFENLIPDLVVLVEDRKSIEDFLRKDEVNLDELFQHMIEMGE